MRAAWLAITSFTAACTFRSPTIGGDGGSVDAAADPDARDAPSTDAPDGGTSMIGCVPPGWRKTHEDTFDGNLAMWHLDTNVNPPTLSWATSGSSLLGHSASSGTDVAMLTGAIGDSAVVTHMKATSLVGSPGFRVGGPLLRAASIDGANNLYYACLIDQAAGMVYFGRYDVETQIGSGQSWTHYADVPVVANTTMLITLCGQGTTITCDIPSLGVHVTMTDARYQAGQPGLRVMLADVAVEDFAVYEP